MCKFIGLFHYHHQDLFVCKAKEVGKGNDNLYDCLPDSLCDCEFEGIPCDFSEESSDGFVVSESLDKGEDVVLQADDSRVSDEFCEVTSLTLARGCVKTGTASFVPERLSNGDTIPELLSRSRYPLMVSGEK